MRYGTSHFTTLSAAYEYYRTYGYWPEDVDFKVACGEITIGYPELSAGERLEEDPTGRFHIIKDT